MRTLTSTLLAAQKKDSLYPALKITLTQGATTVILYEDRILNLSSSEEPYRAPGKLVCDNSDGYFTDLTLQGYKAVISDGLITKAGKEYSDVAPLWVMAQTLNSVEGQLICTLTMVGIPDLLTEDRASANYIPLDADTKTVKTLIVEILGATLACFSHCTAYEVVWDSEDDLIDSYKPKDSFRIYTNGSRLAAIRRLLDYTKCVPRWGGDGKVHILNPTTTGTTYDYEYSLEDGHTFFAKAYRKTLVIPNRVIVQSRTDDDPQYSGEATDAASYALLPKTEYQQMRLSSDDEADDIAEAILSKYQLNAEMGAANVPMNCGAELFDYVKVTDSREGDYRVGNIGSLTRNYSPGKYTLSFSFGNWLTVRKLLNDLETNSDVGNYFAKLIVDDLYAKHIQADSLDMVWLDPEGNIDLSLIGDDLDSLPDGELYARIKSMHLDAGVLRLDENVFYKSGYNPSQKRRTFTATPTTPYDVGDLWLDASNVKRCTTARATGAYVAGDWTATTIDAIADGTTFQRVKSSALTAGGLVILDQVVTGTYGLVLATDISAGHIKLSSVEQSSSYRTVTDTQKTTWTDKPDNMDEIGEGSTYQRVRATDISAGHLKLTSSIVISGTWYNSGGVTIDAGTGIKIDAGIGGNDLLVFKNGAYTGNIHLGSNGYLYLYPGTGGDVVTRHLRPDADNTYILGDSSYRWLNFYCKGIIALDLASRLNLPQLSSAPSSPGAGCCFFNTTTHHFQFYTGSAWVIAQESGA